MKKSKLQQITVQPWTTEKLKLHKEAVRRLERILALAALLVGRKKSLTEEKLYHFMVERMRAFGLTSMLGWVIVAYGSSAAEPHYAFRPGKSRPIKSGHFLLLDIWGKLNQPDAPYGDITHTYFVGKNPPARFQKLWHDLRSTRDRALTHLTANRTTRGASLHAIAEKHLNSCGYPGLFLHGLGHDLGVDHVHGPGANLSPRFRAPLISGRGYTIEPGIYKKGAFGLRSEMDFFFDRNRKVQVTTRLQQDLECIRT